MKVNKTQKGITLVALIITIIVLLILAVVAIRAVTGDGIIAHAKNASSKYNQAQIEERVRLAQYEYQLATYNSTDTNSFLTYLAGLDWCKSATKNEADGSITIVTNTDETYTVTLTGTTVADGEQTPSPSPVTLINFTICEIPFQAEKGMTWEEWCNSDYYTGSFTNGGEIIVIEVIKANGIKEILQMSSTDVIENERAYKNIDHSGGLAE